jgi:hypothetical protein
MPDVVSGFLNIKMLPNQRGAYFLTWFMLVKSCT